ncbi:hypothetical protein, partial [Lysobacter sp. TAB13]|uniref:hypothetical protein n=1 Tax=Lysobacter sp. TAB13 TaxID=3233065 RepID=UPI003F95FC9C
SVISAMNLTPFGQEGRLLPGYEFQRLPDFLTVCSKGRDEFRVACRAEQIDLRLASTEPIIRESSWSSGKITTRRPYARYMGTTQITYQDGFFNGELRLAEPP